MPAADSAGQHKLYIAAIDRKGPGGHAARPGVQGSPQRLSRQLPTETAREEYGGARSSHPFGAGAGSQPVAAAGTGC